MTSQGERILTRISDAELARRWHAVRHAMHERKIDALVIQATNDWLGGFANQYVDDAKIAGD